MIDTVLMEIMATKPNEYYQAWLKDRKGGTSHFEPVVCKQDSLNKKNLNISKMIDSLNKKIKG